MAQMKMYSNLRAGPGICSHRLLFPSSSHSNSCVVCCSIHRCSVVLGQVWYYVLLHPTIGLCEDLVIVYTAWRLCSISVLFWRSYPLHVMDGAVWDQLKAWPWSFR
jgi:hypothetical protein